MTETDAAILAAEAAPATESGGQTEAKGKNEWLEALKTLVVVAVVFLGFRTVLFQPFTIPSASMEPNLLEGDYIVVSKFAYGVSHYSLPLSPPLFGGRVFGRPAQRGDIVVFKLPRDGRTDYVKRVVGLPGDRIQMRNGAVWLNGKPLQREELAPGYERTDFGFSRPVHRFLETLPNGKSYLTWGYGSDGDVDNTGVYVVPPGHYFVMGDNRDNSEDSRYPEQIGVGYVPAENLEGRADVVMFSLTGSGLRTDRVFKALN
jgi:signal peptidase I